MSKILFVGEHAITYEVCWHTHDHWELVYCTAGEGVFRFENDDAIHYSQGDTVVIPPRVRHSNTGPQGFTNIHIQIEDLAVPYREPFRVSDNQDHSHFDAFRQAKGYFLTDSLGTEQIMSALAELIAGQLVDYCSTSQLSQPVAHIRYQILRNYSDPAFALDACLEALPLHYDYLRKLFQKEMGVTPLEYLTALRMKKASAMLTAQGACDYSMTEVARFCGYKDALYFSRVFKKTYGVSPRAYANRAHSQEN